MRPTTHTGPTRADLSPAKRGTRALLTLLLALTASGPISAGLTTAAAHAEACPNQSLRSGPSETLPDCRAYEQVSPTDKGGYDAISPYLSLPAQAAPSGNGVVYMGSGPFPGAQGSFLPDARLSTRGSAGWQTTDVTPPSLEATPPTGLSAGVAGYNFSEDLSRSVIKIVAPPRAPSGEQLYHLFLTDNGRSSLVDNVPPAEFAPQGAECYETGECYATFNIPAFAGASTNFDRVLFEADGSLEGTSAPGGFVTNLYESSAGQLHLVGILPDGATAPAGAQPGAGGQEAFYTNALVPSAARWLDINHAMSADGKRVLFTAAADGGAPDAFQSGMSELYDRIDGSHTVEVSAPAAGATPANTNPEPAQFWAASSDGSLAYFTSSAELTTSSNTGTANNSSDIYRYDVNNGALRDITVDTNPIDASTGAGVQGIAGVSEDGSYVYFVATGQLVNGKGTDGERNLYLWHEDPSTHATELKFITTLAEGDSADWTSTPASLRAYVTPDGRHLAFSSLNSLTGYDNRNPETNLPQSEIYEYSAGTSMLACASCAPSGAPPVSGAFTGTSPHEAESTAFHQPRVLSDDGTRLFFSSADSVLPGHATIARRIYEYEQPTAGSCELAQGCIYQLTSGSSGATGLVDVFLDADATGSNIFFATVSQLAPTDGDGLVDVYDARVGGGIPAPSGSPCSSGCSGEGITSPPATSAPGSQLALGTVATRPGKSTPPPKTGKKAKPLTCGAKAKKLTNRTARARALKRCLRLRNKRTSHGRTR